MDSSPIIELRHVSRTYTVGRERIAALRDMSLTINQGEIVAITGPSGSGKSTLLQLIGCLDQPTSGEIIIDGKAVQHLSDRALSQVRRATIGFIFQSFYLQPFLKLKDNIAVPAMFSSQEPDDIMNRVTDLLTQVGLSDRMDHFPRELSGGQIQRAAIARALMNQPAILLADEPTGNLDSSNSQAIVDLFKNIREKLGTTIIIVTHNPEIAAQTDRTIVLKDGVII